MKNIKTYAKGARAERDLLHFLNHKGYSVLRVPSSGGFVSPVDLVALKRNIPPIVFECKAWAKKPRLAKAQLRRFKDWCERAGAFGFVAWYSKGKWLFLPLKNAENNEYDDHFWIDRDHAMRLVDINYE